MVRRMSRQQRIHVAGAGAFGLACALGLAEAGAAVTVFDPAPGANASAVAAGMLGPAFESALDVSARPHVALLRSAISFWPSFAEQAGLRLDRRGALAVGDGQRLADLEQGLGDLGFSPKRIGRARLRDLAPGLSETFGEALIAPEDWRIEAAECLAALRRRASDLGVAFRPEALRTRGDADLVVIATGPSRALLDLAPELAALSPIKGHILRLPRFAYSGLVVRGPRAYAAPADGGITVGATMEAGLADLAVDAAHVDRLLEAGRELFPTIGADAEVRVSVGVRAATPDGLPLVGPSSAPGVLLAAGARRNGWLLAPLAARIVTAWATGGDTGPLAQALAPARFAAA